LDLSARFGLGCRILQNVNELQHLPDDLLHWPESISPILRRHIDQSWDYLAAALA
jgi:hypothetical protein